VLFASHAGVTTWRILSPGSRVFGATEDQRRGAALAGTSAHAQAPSLLVDGHHDFALALYEQLVEGSRNLFFSPLSIRTALGMARVGAKGETV
jgi:hypothetical protein